MIDTSSSMSVTMVKPEDTTTTIKLADIVNHEESINTTTSNKTKKKQKRPSSSKQFLSTNYMILYDEVMKNRDSRELFKSYLRNIAKSEEALLFLDEYEEYQQKYSKLKILLDSHVNNHGSGQYIDRLGKNFMEVYGMANLIVDTFLREGSERELNLGKVDSLILWDTQVAQEYAKVLNMEDNISSNSSSSNNKKDVASDSFENALNSYANVINLIEPSRMLGDVLFSTHYDLKADQFPRFSRSQYVYDFLQKQGEAYTRSIAVDISKGFNVDFRFKPKDLSRLIIYDRDIFFAFSLMDDSPDWELVTSKHPTSRAQFYYSKTPYVFENQESKGMHLNKMVTIIPKPLDYVWRALKHVSSVDSNRENIRNVKMVHLEEPVHDHEQIEESERTSLGNPLSMRFCSCLIDLKGPLMKLRNFPHTHTSFYDEGIQGYMCIGHTTMFKDYEIPKDQIKGDLLFFYLLVKVNEHSTRVIVVSYYDAHLPPLLHKLVALKAWKKRSYFVEECLDGKHTVNEEWTDITDMEGSLQDNLKIYPNRSWYKEYVKKLRK